MTTRREFIQVTLTASVGGAVAATAGETLSLQPLQPAQSEYAGTVRSLLRAPARPARLPLYAALFDRRFSDSRRFSVAARRLGIAIRPISGDVTDVWYSELHPRWKESAVPIAGITTYGPLFCLERLAWDHGMRVVYRGSHQRRSDRTIEHRLDAAAPQLGALHHKLSGRDAWPVEIAALMAGISPLAKPLPLNRNGLSTITCVGQCAPTASEPGEALYSWVIAPRARA
jgi:hypothetical protein